MVAAAGSENLPQIVETWQFIVVTPAGWLNRQQQDVLAFLREENRVFREQLKGKRIRLPDDQRRRLAAKGTPDRLVAIPWVYAKKAWTTDQRKILDVKIRGPKPAPAKRRAPKAKAGR